jgi:hypothetical protein
MAPVGSTVVHTPKAAVQTAARVQHHAARVLDQEVPGDGIQYVRPKRSASRCVAIELIMI